MTGLRTATLALILAAGAAPANAMPHPDGSPGPVPLYRGYVAPPLVLAWPRWRSLRQWDDAFFAEKRARPGRGVPWYGDRYGFYPGLGEGLEVVNDQAIYHYDRGYPYDYYPPEPVAVADEGWQDEAPRRHRRSGCRTQWVEDGGSGEKVPVRICSGS